MQRPNDKSLIIVVMPLLIGLLSVALLLMLTFELFGVRHGPNLVGATASLLSVFGLVLYYLLPKTYRSSKLFRFGIYLNFAASVWGFALIFR